MTDLIGQSLSHCQILKLLGMGVYGIRLIHLLRVRSSDKLIRTHTFPYPQLACNQRAKPSSWANNSPYHPILNKYARRFLPC
jgi:hypothetical protein